MNHIKTALLVLAIILMAVNIPLMYDTLTSLHAVNDGLDAIQDGMRSISGRVTLLECADMDRIMDIEQRQADMYLIVESVYDNLDEILKNLEEARANDEYWRTR